MPGTESDSLEWPANKVRETFFKFFEGKLHVDWKSSPVVPVNDPTLLFANAGPGPNARIVYIDGAFDLFHAGHVEAQDLISRKRFVITFVTWGQEYVRMDLLENQAVGE